MFKLFKNKLSSNKELTLDIEKAKSIIENGCEIEKIYSKWAPIYPFCTENIAGYFEKLDFKDKKVLTVASSGDHVFNSILRGAKEIEVFDINRLTSYYIELKKAAISVMKYEEFLDFFTFTMKNKDTAFEKKEYKKISDFLSKEDKFFWDSLYKEYSGSDLRSKLFVAKSTFHSSEEESNLYLNEEQYYKLQKKINQVSIKFIESDVVELDKRITNMKYDLIMLSNISDYIGNLYNGNELESYRKLVLDLSKNLNENGTIVFAYIYSTLKSYVNKYKLFYNKEDRERVFEKEKFNIHYFETFNGLDKEDAIMTYTKK